MVPIRNTRPAGPSVQVTAIVPILKPQIHRGGNSIFHTKVNELANRVLIRLLIFVSEKFTG